MKYWDKAWSLVDGCTPVSPGCDNCWSRAMVLRFRAGENFLHVRTREDRLTIPLAVKKPTIWSVWNDLFHEGLNIRGQFIREAFRVMAVCQRHGFLILTKRPERMRAAIDNIYDPADVLRLLPNVWLGVTAETQEWADKRIPILLQTPAAVRFVSVEPMLGPVDLEPYLHGIDWVICGAETGPRARPIEETWVYDLVAQCRMAGVPFWFKSWGTGKGRLLLPHFKECLERPPVFRG